MGFDFSSVAGDVVSDIHASQAEVPAEQPVAQPTEQAEPPQEQQAPVEQPVEERFYTVKANGKTFQVPESELIAGYSRQADYTQKTMALAERERQWQGIVQKYQDYYQNTQRILQDPRIQSAMAAQQNGTATADEVATVAGVQSLVERQLQNLQQQFRQEIQLSAERAEQERLTAHYTQQVEATISGVLDKHNILKDVDGIDQLLWRDMAARGPQSIEEAQRFVAEAAAARAQKLTARLQQEQTNRAVQQAAALKGIEPKGGTAVQSAPVPQGTKLGSQDLRKAALADIQALMTGS